MRHEVCSSQELVSGQPIKVVLDNHPIALVRDSAGVAHALGDTCTHGDISLSEGFIEGDTLECWAHGSKFSMFSGRPLTLPAYEPVPVYEVLEQDGRIFIDPDVLVPVED